jgi:hypothetical protein
METLYYFNIGRNKSSIKNKSVSVLKRELTEKNGKRCYLCEKDFKNGDFLELEHKIPVCVGGKVFCKSNLGLVCSKCHSKKTKIDLDVIFIMKKLIFNKQNSMYPLEFLRGKYKELFNLAYESNNKFKIWYEGSNGEDYYNSFDGSNRVVLE